jgi:hypothetical protein
MPHDLRLTTADETQGARGVSLAVGPREKDDSGFHCELLFSRAAHAALTP